MQSADFVLPSLIQLLTDAYLLKQPEGHSHQKLLIKYVSLCGFVLSIDKLKDAFSVQMCLDTRKHCRALGKH